MVYLVIVTARGDGSARPWAVGGALLLFGPRIFAIGLIEALGAALSTYIGIEFGLGSAVFVLVLVIYLSIRFALVGPIIVLENRTIPAAIMRS